METVDEIKMRPTLSFLSQEDKEKIHRAVINILSDIGVKIIHDEALALLKGAGCPVVENNMAKIPEEFVLKAIDSAPDNIAIYDR
jgi:trimethylamine--corrinoid protein Co-methyltransferase